MSRTWNRTETWLALIVLGIGLLLIAIPGVWMYMSMTATPLHPRAQDVPSEAHRDAFPRWVDAAQRGRHVVRAGITEQNLPGVSVAVGVGGDIVWAEGFGWADLEERVPVRPDTPFRIGTASTVLTSAAVGLLLEEGRLQLEDAVQVYVPGFPEKPWPVRLRQLMGHVAGVRNDAGDEEPVTARCTRAVDALHRFADRPLLFEPGSRYHYSSYGWFLVSAAVETSAAEPFASFMLKRVFEPLGMHDTRVDSAGEVLPGRATYYFPRFAADPRYGPQPPAEVDYSCFAGASGILSTPSDLVRFGMALNSGTLLQPATVQVLQAPQRLASGQETGHGLGWDVETVSLAGEETGVVGCDGKLRGGMVASFMVLRERGIVVAVTSNTSYADTSSLALSLARVFAGVAAER